MYKILIVDDEKRMRDLLSLYLTPIGYVCTSASSGNDAIEYIHKQRFDLIILDVMMPGLDGWETCKLIRTFSTIPIIMLTARTDKEDIVKGLHVGADDYIVKPFDVAELTARMEALFRRTKQQTTQAIIECNGLIWNTHAHTLKYRDELIQVTPKQFSLIGLLLKHQNQVFSREQLLENIWGNEVDTEDRTIDSHIRNIREKLRRTGFPIDTYLITVWGIGYQWKTE